MFTKQRFPEDINGLLVELNVGKGRSITHLLNLINIKLSPINNFFNGLDKFPDVYSKYKKVLLVGESLIWRNSCFVK